MWVARSYEKTSSGQWNVTVHNTIDNRDYNIDVWINTDYNDVECDWNQYIFDKYDSDDCERMAVQDSAENFENATSEAIDFLEQAGELMQEDSGNWFEVK